MGRLVSTHEAPATPKVNPFLPVAKESDNGECQFLNFCSPPGTERIPGAGVNGIKMLLNVNFLQRRDGNEPQQRGVRRRVLPRQFFSEFLGRAHAQTKTWNAPQGYPGLRAVRQAQSAPQAILQ